MYLYFFLIATNHNKHEYKRIPTIENVHIVDLDKAFDTNTTNNNNASINY